MDRTIINGREPVYQRLAGVLETMIQRHSLRPGDRMPSVRQFSRQQRVSVPTALQAYATLETRGLIAARPKSGFFVQARQADFVREPDNASAPQKVTDLDDFDPLESLLADHSNPRLVPFGAAVPSGKLLPAEKLARLMLQWCGDGRISNGSIRVKVSLTHEEIAQLIGTSRESVTRTLGELKRQHILELSGSTLTVRNKTALEGLVMA